MKKVLISLCFFTLFTQLSRASSHHALLKAKFSGDYRNITAIRIVYGDHYVYNMINVLDTVFALNKDGEFSMNIPMNDSIGKIFQFGLQYFGDHHDNSVITTFVVQSGDRVTMHIGIQGDNIVTFSCEGTGSAKYQCAGDNYLAFLQHQVQQKHFDDSLGGRFGIYNHVQSIEALYQNDTAYCNSQMRHLALFQSSLSPLVREIMYADILGNGRQWFGLISRYYHNLPFHGFAQNDSVAKFLREKTRQFYFSHHRSLEILPDPAVSLSPDYVDFYILLGTGVALSFEQRREGPSDVKYTDIFNRLRDTFVGQLRERLLMLMIVDPGNTIPYRNPILEMSSDSQRHFVEEALSFVQTPSLREAISQSPLVRSMPGTEAYNFDLQDTADQKIRLSDFKGSLVLMDMWFTGCTGCARFGLRLKNDIKPKITPVDNIKFVSICTDDDPKLWLKSLYTGPYTEPDNINLHLPAGEDMAFFSNPMIHYYGLQGLPFILLIDQKGKIIKQFSATSKTDDVLALIRRYENKRLNE